MYKLKKLSKLSKARRGHLKTVRGVIETPFFMPIASKGAVKNISTGELADLGAQIILSNVYHLYLKPGEKIIKNFGGLHKFMNWPGRYGQKITPKIGERVNCLAVLGICDWRTGCRRKEGGDVLSIEVFA